MGQWFPFRRSSQKALGSKAIVNRRGWTFASFSCDLFDLLPDLLFDLVFVAQSTLPSCNGRDGLTTLSPLPARTGYLPRRRTTIAAGGGFLSPASNRSPPPTSPL